MKVGIIGGTGAIGSALAARLAIGGADVMLGSRDLSKAGQAVERLTASWSLHSSGSADGSLTPVTVEAAAEAGIVILATPWLATLPLVITQRQRLSDKTVISVINPLRRVGDEYFPLGDGASAAMAIKE